MAKREVKLQHDTDLQWARAVAARPGCEGLLACTQCGNCSGTCPLSIYMDVTPRRIMAMVREGFRTEVLQSQTIWLCTCCYACAVDCPQSISVTDVMFALKREAIECRIAPRRSAVPVLAHQFLALVRTQGRAGEALLAARMLLRSDVLGPLRMLRLAWRLRRTGRLPVLPQHAGRLDSFRGDLSTPLGGD